MIKYGPKLVTSGLEIVFDAANSRSYSGTGTNWHDLSGKGNDGTIAWAVDRWLELVQL